MRAKRTAASLAMLIALTASGSPGQFDTPNPKVYAHAEDQQKARLLRTPCRQADIGQGCHRRGEAIVRNLPCAHELPSTSPSGFFEFLPTQECYKMDRPRRFRGVWIDEFEGQEFVPDGQAKLEWPRSGVRPEERERVRATKIWIDFSLVGGGRKFRDRGGGKSQVEFIGRKTRYAGSYGHMGLFAHYIIVDRVISVRDISD